MSEVLPFWYRVANVPEVPSPALLIYPDRVEENVRRMIQLAGGAGKLRPHLKTHKLAEVVRLQMAEGISKFKTATIAETEMAAECGATDLLLAYQPVGPNVGRLVELTKRYPKVRIGAIVDDEGAAKALSKAFSHAKLTLEVWLDLDCGMHRTGIPPNDAAVTLYQTLSRMPGLQMAGLHAYDGHLHDKDPDLRRRRCDEAFAAVAQLQQRVLSAGCNVPRIVAGGTPTFPFHAQRPGVECSPGTCLLWDAGYSSKMPDLDFLVAAVVLTRVVSRPAANRLCLDLGHKAIASENPPPRVELLGIPDVQAVMHSEEHLVVEFPGAHRFSVGDCLYGVPWHICPTVALHAEATVIRQGRAEGRWLVRARQRILSV